jgi:hypothetical protein
MSGSFHSELSSRLADMREKTRCWLEYRGLFKTRKRLWSDRKAPGLNQTRRVTVAGRISAPRLDFFIKK